MTPVRSAGGRPVAPAVPRRVRDDERELIELIAEIPEIQRIRYTTSHPREVTQRLIDAYARIPKLVSQLHLPVQAGSDRILAAMKRKIWSDVH